MVKCSDTMMKNTGYLHIIALIFGQFRILVCLEQSPKIIKKIIYHLRDLLVC